MARWRFTAPRVGWPFGSAWRVRQVGVGAVLRESADLIAAAALALLSASLASLMPAGSPARIVVTLLVLVTVPGYLLIQTFIVPAKAESRAIHSLLSLGISPAVVGLLALSTFLMPGGFRSATIIATVTVACIVMAAVAFARRSSHPAGIAGSAIAAPLGA